MPTTKRSISEVIKKLIPKGKAISVSNVGKENYTGEDGNLPESKINDLILKEFGNEVLSFIENTIELTEKKTLVISTNTRFNIDKQKNEYYTNLVNLKEINGVRWMNKFFESINLKLPYGGIYINSVETYTHRKKRLLKRFYTPFNWIIYTLDFIVTRVFPKLWLAKNFYFFLTKGKGRVLSKAETLGRLYSCGFEVINEDVINNKLYFAVRKTGEPHYDPNPTYGPFIKLKRSGKGGKLIKVYKLRTMHPYSEYIQKYVYDLHGTSTGDKADNDFRINTIGRVFRKFWLDELPMFINFFNGDLKLVGVRPLSNHKLSIYPTELQELRKKHKPGLVPPYYADLPSNQKEMWESEKLYLIKYEQSPFLTDTKYFFKAFNNIVFKRARSG